jgi:hypothetical protein
MKSQKLHIFITNPALVLEYADAPGQTIRNALSHGNLMDEAALLADQRSSAPAFLDLGLAVEIPDEDDFNFHYTAREIYEEIKLGTDWRFTVESKSLGGAYASLKRHAEVLELSA